ncbi:alpha/beta hydrolase [Algoriphagus winogradskyi]|uniref:S-formylglutathione hydrolase FrmB n=1 Tax=Algoriphagus winogradskyi TaxID=237017 RepID=A0ABY1NX83_9BACT|nr:alpha/beta hydrolase-fold protein [Algoriphagus winogradskyi]SMP21020.1 S-formylglutathione hydrolase FrmB [Algoriphagus winogradskyi]
MSSFRTIELSDEKFEQDGLRFLTVKTPNLKGRGDICLFVPDVLEGMTDLPIYILLHGVYGSAWVWAMKGGAHHTSKRMMESGEIRPAIIAMPSDGLWGDGSGYLRHRIKDFAQWIVSDVPRAVYENISQASENSPLCITGLSMGGYGALRLGAEFPDQFKAISAHSAITKFSEMGDFVEEPLDSFDLMSQEMDVIASVRKNAAKLPPMRFDCGKSDELIEGNRLLHTQLLELGVTHEYEELEGGHEWTYWQSHLERSLRFFDQTSFK